MGLINWRDFFSVPDFSEGFKLGFIMAKRYLSQYVP